MCQSYASGAEAMPGLGKGDLSPAILCYLRSVGVLVRAGKLSPSQENKPVSAPARRLFGLPLRSLPLSARAEGVPQFLVDACELLRLHLHVEGLFRKTGSMTRIEALKARLEAGENCLHMALPCDVATLVKQFLRGLPEPLVPAELQGPLCRVQQRQEKDRGPLTVLLTCLLPPASASTLRYFFGFLQDVAARCSQNKMDLANLAIIFSPSLFSSELCGKLDGAAEELLQTQAAVVELLITCASEIGTVPPSLLGKVQAAFSDTECQRLSPPGSGDRRGGEVERRRKRQRRRSVGDIVTEALSKFKSGRALRAAPRPETKEGVRPGDEPPNHTTPRTSFNSKRKASEDEVASHSELSAKKRRSASDSGCSDSSNEEVFQQLVDVGPVEGSPGLSSDEDSPPSIDQQAPKTAVKCKHGTGTSPGMEGVSCQHRELSLSGGAEGQAEGRLGPPAEAAHPPRQLRVLRRSLSWPEDLSTREAAKRGETYSFPEEVAIEPGDHPGLAEPGQPGEETRVAGMRQAGLPAVCVALADGYGAACPDRGPHDIPSSLRSPEPDLPDYHGGRAAGSFRKVPQSILKRFALNFQQPLSLPNEGLGAARPKRKGGRRFGRSLSHESGLPLRAEEGAGCAAKQKGGASPSPKSPLQAFKAYGRQIFITHKYWALTFAGLRGRKGSTSTSPQETVRATADSRDSHLGRPLEGERHRYQRSPKFPLPETQLMAGPDSLDL